MAGWRTTTRTGRPTPPTPTAAATAMAPSRRWRTGTSPGWRRRWRRCSARPRRWRPGCSATWTPGPGPSGKWWPASWAWPAPAPVTWPCSRTCAGCCRPGSSTSPRSSASLGRWIRPRPGRRTSRRCPTTPSRPRRCRRRCRSGWHATPRAWPTTRWRHHGGANACAWPIRATCCATGWRRRPSTVPRPATWRRWRRCWR